MTASTLLGIGAVVALFLWLARRANEVFCLSIRGGRTLLVRGRIPPGLASELREVVRRARLSDATIRCVREGGMARLVLEGGDERIEQQLRNVFGSRPWRDLRLAQPPAEQNLGQRLGWTWLAWRLHDRR